MVNPFYIQPASDFSRGLAGLSQAVGEYGEVKREKEVVAEEKAKEKAAVERLTNLKQGALEAYQTGDPNVAMEYSIANPEMAGVLQKASAFRSKITEENFKNTLFDMYLDPSEDNVKKLVEGRKKILKEQGVIPAMSKETDGFEKEFKEDPEKAKKKIAMELAFRYPDKWKAYQEAVGGQKQTPTAKMKEYQQAVEQGFKGTLMDYQKKLKETPAKTPTPYSDAAKLNSDLKAGLISEAEYNKAKEKIKPENTATPYTDLAKLKKDYANNLIDEEDYDIQRNKLLNPTAKNKLQLTQAALNGDPEAIATLEKMRLDDISMAKEKGAAAAEGKIAGLHKSMDLDSTAQSVFEGRETIDRVKNTFGVPIQEVVRQKVLAMDPNFNFLQPTAIYNSLKSSLQQQQKNRGAMGSFVQNINGQVDKLETIGNDIVSRIGVRAMDIPIRKLKTSAIGSGDERVFEAYMKEISAEIYKLSQGSTASVAMLPEQGRKEWEKIHDVNLSMNELNKVLRGTREMANIRLKSVDDEIERTVGNLGSVKAKTGQQGTPLEEIEAMQPGEIFIGPDGKQYRKR